MSHTKGKLTAVEDTISDHEGEPIAYLEWSGCHEEDARRLVACWNALLPFTTEQIENARILLDKNKEAE